MAREQLQNLSEPMYYVLLSLQEENFGYQIMEDVKNKTNGRVTIGAGTLYALLARFETNGYIIQTKEVERRKMYKIATLGEEALYKEFQRIKNLYNDGKQLEKNKENQHEKNN